MKSLKQQLQSLLIDELNAPEDYQDLINLVYKHVRPTDTRDHMISTIKEIQREERHHAEIVSSIWEAIYGKNRSVIR